jgi:hypothetical protein
MAYRKLQSNDTVKRQTAHEAKPLTAFIRLVIQAFVIVSLGDRISGGQARALRKLERIVGGYMLFIFSQEVMTLMAIGIGFTLLHSGGVEIVAFSVLPLWGLMWTCTRLLDVALNTLLALIRKIEAVPGRLFDPLKPEERWLPRLLRPPISP